MLGAVDSPYAIAASANLCAAHPCSLCWPTDPWATCAAPVAEYRNILLKNVSVDSPRNSVGVLLANASSPIRALHMRTACVCP